MPNGLDAKVNGSGTPRKPGETPATGGSSGDGGGHPGADADPALSGLAVANLPFVEELYFKFLSDPASVEPSWRRYFQSLNGSGGNGGGTPPSAAPVAFRRSIFAGGAASAVPGPSVTGNRTSVRLLSERVQR